MFEMNVYTIEEQYYSVYSTFMELNKHGHPFIANQSELLGLENKKNPFVDINFCANTTTIFVPKKGMFETYDFLLPLLQKGVKLIINISTEGYNNYFFRLFYRYMEDYDVDYKNIIYLSGALNIEEKAKQYFLHNNIPKEKQINAFSHIAFNYVPYMKDTLRIPNGFSKDKLFLCLNRRNRPQRSIIVSQLLKRKLENFGFISFFQDDDVGNDYTKGVGEDYIEDVKEYITHDLHVDNIDPLENQANGKSFGIIEFYERSFISLVTETLFYESEIFPSEKTFRPMMYKQPILLAGPRFLLRELRMLGFKTFSPFMDESYDEIENHHERIEAIINEAERLSKLSHDDLNEWLWKLDEVLEHNRRWLLYHRHKQILNTSLMNIVNLLDK